MKHRLNWGMVIALCALTGVTCVIITLSSSAALFGRLLPGYEENRQLLAKVGEIADLIDDQYVGETDEAALADWAAAGLVSALGDQYSRYIPASEVDDYQANKYGESYGVGVQCIWDADEQAIHIYAVLDGSSAMEAGLQKGDWITGADGVTAQEIGYTALIERIKGEVGTTVEVDVRRAATGGTETLTLERRKLEQLMSRGELLADGTGLIHIYNFHQGAADQFRAAYNALKKQGIERLIIDVRHDGGGLVSEMAEIADIFLPEGDIIITRRKDGTESRKTSDAKQDEIPLAVLVDEQSYSAAEFFAAVMQEYGRAVTVGAQTTGKERAQNVYTLADGSAVVLSDQMYCTPKGRALGDTGMTPDIEIALPEGADFYFLEPANDPQVQAALRAFDD